MASSTAHITDLSQAMVTEPVPLLDWLIIAPAVLPLFAGAILLILRGKPQMHATYATWVMMLHFLLSCGLFYHVTAHGPRTMTMGSWLPPFGISFSADLLGVLLTATASLLALVCILFSADSISSQLRRNGFYVFIILMMGGVSGAFLTGDIFNLYVWFEVLLISSFGLIVIGGEKLQLDGTIKYAFLNFIATTLFLIATGYLYGAMGTLNMADIRLKLEGLDPNAPINTIATLYFIAFAMKAAAFPLNFWLPASYHTPRLVVSALFAGLLTKVGIYALLRVVVMLFGEQTSELSFIIVAIAMLTMLLGALGAIAQNDIRRIAGYLVVTGIGSMMAGIALSTQTGLAGTMFYAVHSMLCMTAIYLVLAMIGIRAGTYQLRELGGFYAASPWFSVGFLVLAFAVAGLPPFSGFWPKYLLVKASLDGGAWWLAAVILVSALLSMIAVFRIWIFVFWRSGPQDTPDGAEKWVLNPVSNEQQLAGAVSIAILVLLVMLLGLQPSGILDATFSAAKGLLYPNDYIQSVFGGAR